MRLNPRRIIRFFYHRRAELLTAVFWRMVVRVALNRFNFWDRVGEVQFRRNLDILHQRPSALRVEINNLCNANCVFCAYQFQERPHEQMSDEVYTETLRQFQFMGGGNLLLENTMGDPFVDSRYIDKIRQARAIPEIRQIISITNLIAMKSSQAEALLTSGLTGLKVSLGPMREDLYELVYRSKSYQKVRRNIRLVLETNKALGNPVDIHLCFRSHLSMQETLALPDYQEIAGLPHQVEFNADFDTWTGVISESILPKGMHIRPTCKPEAEPCALLLDGPIVFSSGKIGMCGCRDFNANSELIVGNIIQDSLPELWHSERVRAIWDSFAAGNPPKICQSCTFYTNLDYLRTKGGVERCREVAELWEKAPARLGEDKARHRVIPLRPIP